MNGSSLPAVVVLLACLALPAGAEDPPAAAADAGPEGPAGDLALEALLRVKVESASKMPQSLLEAPSVVSLVTQRTIESYGWQTLNDVLYAQPGFFPSQQTERLTVGARGLYEAWSNNHLLVLVDGVPFADAETGTAYTWDVTPLFPWSAVEIVRGPGSALYGSGAVNGVVSLLTPSAAKAAAHPSRTSLRWDDHGAMSVEASTASDARLAAAYVGFRYGETGGNGYLDYDASGRTNPDGSLARFPVADRRRSLYALGKVEAKGPLEGLSLQVHHQEWHYQTGHGWGYMIPDTPDQVHEWRDLAIARYQTPTSGRLSTDLVLRLQRHSWDYRVRIYAAGSTVGGVSYPQGAEEGGLFATDDLFTRAQVTWRPGGDASLLAGVEDSALFTHPNMRHTANFDVSGGTYEPFPEGDRAIGDNFEQIRRHPMHRTGAYLQGVSGRLLDGSLALTAGLRWDLVSARYLDLADQASRTYREQQVSPRLAAVLTPTDRLSLKLSAAEAFRAPVAGELFAANTATQASNPATLRPEKLRTFEAVVDWLPADRLSLRANAYHLAIENVVGWNGLFVSNLYDRQHAGLELEGQVDADLGSGGRLAGFASYSYVRLLSETAKAQPPGAQAVDASSRLTWAPAHLAKAGLNWQRGGLNLAATLRYQSAVERRASDLATPEYRALRPDRIAGFSTADVNATWQVASWARLGLSVTNLLETSGPLVNPGDYPFDYLPEGRRVVGSVVVEP